MKSKRFSVPLLVAFVLACGAFAYAKNFPLTASSVVPAASGNVEVKIDKNNNTAVTIKTVHLAEPGMLTPPANSYVVWFQQQGDDPMNQGQLKIGKDLKGEFKATTNLRNFDIRVTAEPDPLAKTPAGQTVMQSKVQAN